MCATCVAQGAVYVGGAVGALQVLRHRARRRPDRAPAAGGPGEARDTPNLWTETPL